MKLIQSNELIKQGLTIKTDHLNQIKSNTRNKLTKFKQEQNIKYREKEGGENLPLNGLNENLHS